MTAEDKILVFAFLRKLTKKMYENVTFLTFVQDLKNISEVEKGSVVRIQLFTSMRTRI
jgi:hypothetical protein